MSIPKYNVGQTVAIAYWDTTGSIVEIYPNSVSPCRPGQPAYRVVFSHLEGDRAGGYFEEDCLMSLAEARKLLRIGEPDDDASLDARE